MQAEKYGFIYIWFDRKHKRYYVGSHWGTEDDGYVCSSNWMRTSQSRRPEDFKRRIISRIYERDNLLKEEQRWLSMMKKKELKTRYYNFTNVVSDPWHGTEDGRKSISEKISIRGKEKWQDPEYQEKQAEFAERRRGTKSSSEKVEKQRVSMKAKMAEKFPIEKRQQRLARDSEELLEVYRQKSIEMWATRTEEEKAAISIKIAEANKGKKRRLGQTNSPEHRAKISAANRGRVVSEETRRKLRVPRRKMTEEEKKAQSERIKLSWERRKALKEV